MTQPSLPGFEPPPLAPWQGGPQLPPRPASGEARARRSDPQSSHEAARAMNESGTAAHQRERVIDLVIMHPGRTSKELAGFCEDLDRYQIARRLPEAEEAGEVESRAPGGGEKRWWPRPSRPLQEKE